MGSIHDGIYKPDDDSLPHVELSTLEAGQVTLTIQPHHHEFIKFLWPVYYAVKVSFTCKDATEIKINGETQKCNQTIHFQTRPKSLQINEGNNIWTHTDIHPTTLFLQALNRSFKPWTKQIPPVKLWSSNPSNPHIFEVINEHLKL